MVNWAIGLDCESRETVEMAEFVVKIADDRGRVQQHVEQGILGSRGSRPLFRAGLSRLLGQAARIDGWRHLMRRRRKLKQASFLVFNQQFLTLIRAGLPILNSLELADQAAEGCTG